MKEEDKLLHQFEPLKGNQPFKVPDRYFETFDERMEQVVKRHDTPTSQLIIQMIKPWAIVAALFTLIAIVYNVFNPYTTSRDPLAQVSDTEALFPALLFELTEYDLVTYVVNEDISMSTDAIPEDELAGISPDDIDDLILF